MAIAKDIRRGYTFAVHPTLTVFIPHLHRTPLGMVDLDKPYKQPRPVFYSSFCPHPWCNAINDCTDLSTEPDLIFAGSKMKFLRWLYNLRISYPNEEIYPGDDDVSGAFRQCKYNPFLVAMHSFLIFGKLVLSTGQTFGDGPSPSNWEPIAQARQQLAQAKWSDPTIIAQSGAVLA